MQKNPCDHQRLSPGGAVRVVLELRKAASGAREWVSGETLREGALAAGERLALTVAPGNASFVEFGQAKPW